MNGVLKGGAPLNFFRLFLTTGIRPQVRFWLKADPIYRTRDVPQNHAPKISLDS